MLSCGIKDFLGNNIKDYFHKKWKEITKLYHDYITYIRQMYNDNCLENSLKIIKLSSDTLTQLQNAQVKLDAINTLHEMVMVEAQMDIIFREFYKELETYGKNV